MLPKREWRTLLDEINAGRVVPVVGPQLITVALPDGSRVPLHQVVAPRLAEALDLPDPQSFGSYHDVASAYLLAGQERRDLYTELGLILRDLDVPPPPALLDLAGIAGFRMFVAGTPDPLLARAVAARRPEFDPRRGVVRFHPKGGAASGNDPTLSGNVTALCDIPPVLAGPLVYHVLGDHKTREFAIWEEDYMEFICGLIESRPTLENLFNFLKDRSLLLIGAPSEDWIVRFFLRAARGERLSQSQYLSYLADRRAELSEPLVFFFDKAVRKTRIIDGDPADFVAKLAADWGAAYGPSDDPEELLDRLPEEMPRDSVFISYSRDDLDTAQRVALALASRGLPVWLDRQRLKLAEDFPTRLEHAIKHEASFFVSLISRHTEADPNRYVHTERVWAAQRHVPGYIYYLPLVIDDTPDSEIHREPECFSRVHRERIADGGLDRFANQVRDYVEPFLRDDIRPRG